MSNKYEVLFVIEQNLPYATYIDIYVGSTLVQRDPVWEVDFRKIVSQAHAVKKQWVRRVKEMKKNGTLTEIEKILEAEAKEKAA